MPNIKVGDTVKFRVYDNLFKNWVNAIGKVERKFLSNMWIISAENQSGLQPNCRTWVSEDNINA